MTVDWHRQTLRKIDSEIQEKPKEIEIQEKPKEVKTEDKIEIDRKYVDETSRLAMLKIEKYLMPGELIIYSTRFGLYVNKEANLRGYVTPKRVMFYASKGLVPLLKTDRFFEIPLDSIKKFNLVEKGIVFKKIEMWLNDLKIMGDRSDVLGLYRAIQSQKHL